MPPDLPRCGSPDLVSWQAIAGVARRLAEASSLDAVIRVIADEVQSTLCSGSVALWLLEKRAGALHLVASNVAPELLAPIRTLPLTAPAVAAQVARTGRTIEIPDIQAAPKEFALTREVAQNLGQRSIYARPMIVRGEVIGVLTLATPSVQSLTADQREVVDAFVHLCALAIESTRRLQEAEEARQRDDAILNSITDALYVLDREWRITYVNAAASQLLRHVFPGITDTILGQSIWSLFPDIRGTALDRALHRALEQRISLSCEHFYAPANLWMEVRLYPCPDGLLIYLRDITDRKKVQKERDWLLYREQAIATIAAALVHDVELSSVLDTVVEQSLRTLGVDGVAVWLADPERRALTLHAAHGFRPDFFELKQHLSFDAPYLASRAARTEQTLAIEDVDAPSVSPEARRFYRHEGLVCLIAMPMCARKRLVGIIGYGSRTRHRFAPPEQEFLRTIADLFAVAVENAQLYGQLQTTLRLREEFMAAAAHEMRSPVTVIKGRVQHILQQDLPSPQLRQGLDAVLHQTDRLVNLIEDLLTVARLRPGKVTLSRARFDLSTLVRETVATSSRADPTHPYQVTAPGALVVYADHQLIKEVINRLLENARRFSPNTEPIEVRVRRQGEQAIVTVTDHGIGIAPERQPHVFEPFYEPIPPGEPGYVGIVSLGLYLAKHIVEAHGGQIWLTSTPGSGSTFGFSLPLAGQSSHDG